MSDSRFEKKAIALPEEAKKKKIEITPAESPKNWPLSHNLNTMIAASRLSENKDAANLAVTCRFLYHSTKGALNARKLAHYVVVEPNEEKVTAMLTLDPSLINVLIKEVIDNSGRILINNTAFQLAYGAGDDEMCLAMKPFFVEVYGSEKVAIQEMDRQRTDKVLENKEYDAIKDKEISDHFAALLTPVIEAITNEEFKSGKDKDKKWILTQDTLAAINKFREEFAKSQPKRIEKGMHFRNNTLLETYNAYVQAAALWNYDYKKCALFEDGILSSVLFCAPANDAERFSQGLYYLQRDGQPEKFNRSLALRVGKNNFYLELRSKSSEFSLFGSWVDIVFGEDCTTRTSGFSHAHRRFLVAFIKTYVEQKRQTCRAYAICRTTPEEVSVRNFLK